MMALELIEEAVRSGARRHLACAMLGLDRRTIERWRQQGGGRDRRAGPCKTPGNALSAAERAKVLETANTAEFRDLSPKQIVPRLADQGQYIASESTFYRVLRQQEQLTHRQRSRPAQHQRPRELAATGPCQVWSWDITYLRSQVRGEFFYLYLVEDIWSRKIVGFEVHDRESMDLSAELIEGTCKRLGIDGHSLVLHSDNGGPMKGITMLATLQRLGVVPSFSRPSVSDDNPYSESLFRTMKYRPEYPRQPFESLAAARAWVTWFVNWYNGQHLHSGIRFVTPDDRHEGREQRILEKRGEVYRQARARRPERWIRATRNWSPIATVRLNPRHAESLHEEAA